MGMPIITSVEKYNFEKKGLKTNSIIYRNDGSYFNMISNYNNQHTFFEIKRYLIRDNFNVKIWNYYADNILDTSFLNLNNKIIYSGFEDNPGYQNKMNEESYFFYHHSVLDEKKFKDLSAITSGNGIERDELQKSIKGTLLKEDSAYAKKFITDFNHVIELRSIKSLNFNLVNPSIVLPRGNEKNQYRKRIPSNLLSINLGYNHIFIKPLKPNRLKTTSTVAEIYSFNDDGSEVKYDMKIPDGKVKVSSTDKLMGTYFESSDDKNKKLEGKEQAKFKGYIKISDSSYYDYKSKKTIMGTLHGANFGDTVPFNFKGDYSWIVKSSFNSAFKNVEVTFTTNFKRPLLDKSEGDIILQLTESTKAPPIGTKLKTIKSRDVNLIRNDDYSLEGIRRLMHE